MTHDRLSRATRRSAVSPSTAAWQAIRVGGWNVPVAVIALGLSVGLHGGFLAVLYYSTWNVAPDSQPSVHFAKGDQATQIRILPAPWLDAADGENATSDPPDDTLEAVTIIAGESDVTRPSDDAARASNIAPLSEGKSASITDSSANVSGSREPPADTESEAQDLAEVRVPEDAREAPPTEDADEATPSSQPIEAILDRLIRELGQALATQASGERTEHQKPSVQEDGVRNSVEEAVKPPTEDPVRSDSSPAQTAGIETGAEMLEMPAPNYPSLSRRRGEEGLVMLQVEVLADGSVGHIAVLRDAGYERLTNAAISAARKGRFKPATRNGRPVRDKVRIPFRFVLR
jgi:periplasmic protein TonB